MAETFGQRLSRLRKEKGLTQEDIAKRIIISPQAVSKWENDISSPDILVLSSLADILGVSVDVLLGREDAPEGEETSNEETKEEETVEAERVEPEDRREYVHVGSEGVHIVDSDGSRVDIDDSGIHLTDEHGEHRDLPRHDRPNTIEIIINTTFFGLCLIGYILLGIFWTDKNMGWSMGWILLLLPIIIGSIANAIRKKRITNFAYPVLVVAAYCTIGFLGNYFGYKGWETYWFLFLTIPAFYLIFGPIDKFVIKR